MTNTRWTFCCVLLTAVGLANARQATAAEMDDLVAPGTQAEVLGTGYGFSEGPAVDAQGNVYFSDGKNNAIHLYRPGKGVSLFVSDSTDANGMMFNADGELVVCEGAAFRVVAFDVKTKQKRVLVGDGPRQFNEPNDVAVDSAGGFYFTDPNYKHRGQEAVKKQDVYYVSPEGKVRRVSEVCETPNGILLSPDCKALYLGDCKAGVIYKYDVRSPGVLAGETRWIELLGEDGKPAHPDGMTQDTSGNLYFACGRGGVHVYSSDGKRIGVIGSRYGVDHASNCCFGGKGFSTLYMTSRDKFLGLATKVHGVKPLPLRK